MGDERFAYMFDKCRGSDVSERHLELGQRNDSQGPSPTPEEAAPRFERRLRISAPDSEPKAIARRRREL